LGEFDRAMVDYDRAIELDPQNAVAYRNRAVAHCRQGDLEQALADFDRAIELDPEYAQAYGSRGNIYHQFGEYEKALEDYNKVIELHPNDPAAYYWRAAGRGLQGSSSQLSRCMPSGGCRPPVRCSRC
jgi:tetratricopeptide (TPR) repeat protein